MHSKVFVVEYLDDKEKHDPVDEEDIFRELPTGADYAGEFPLDQYCEKDFEIVFCGCTASVEKKNNGFLVTLDREKLRDFFIARSRILEEKNKKFRKCLETGDIPAGCVSLYELASFVRDAYGLRVYDTALEYQNDIMTWMCDTLRQAITENHDSIQFLVTRVFDWHY